MALLKFKAKFTLITKITKMAVFDQFYQHRKEWSYRDFKDLFGNGMAVGTKWEHVQSLVLTLV